MPQAQIHLSLLSEGGNVGTWSYCPQTQQLDADANTSNLMQCGNQPARGLAQLLAGVQASDRALLERDLLVAMEQQGAFARTFRLQGMAQAAQLCMRGRWSVLPGARAGVLLGVVERCWLPTEQLQATEQRFEQLRSVLQTSPVTLYEQDAQLRYEWALASRVGLLPQDIVGRMASDLMEPACAAEIDSAKQGVMASGKPLRTRFHIRPKGLPGGLFDVYMAPRRGPDGRVNGVVSVAIDMAEASAQEQRLLAIFERAPVAITLSRQSDGIFLKANSTFLELMGYAEDEVIGSSTLALGMWNPPQSRDRMLEELQSTGHVRNMIAGYRKKSGQTGRLLVSAECVEVGGEPLLLGMMTDISALEEARQSLSQSNARYKLLSEASFEGVGLARDGMVVDANEQLAHMLGVPREALIGKSVTDQMTPAAIPKALQVLRAGGDSRSEYAYLRPDGQQVILEVNSKDLVLGGDVLRISAMRDVTEKRQRELELQYLQVRFERMVGSNMVGVYVADLTGGINEANDYFLKLIGCSRSDLDRGLLSWMDLTPQESMQVSLNGRTELLRTGVCTPYEKKYFRSDGTQVDVLVALAHLPATDFQILAIVVDISALKAAQARLNEVNTQLLERTRQAEGAEAAKTLFLSSVTHELRTPLHTMLGHVQLMRKEARGDLLQQLSVVERSSVHLLRLIEDLLEYNHSTIAPERLEPEVVVLDGFLESLQLIGNAATADSANQFFIELGDGLPASMVVDERRLTQVLRILIDNACKYTRAGLVVFTLALDAEQRHADRATPCSLRFAVEDNGRGMDAADVGRIFEPLKRGSNAADRQGLGLGLAIAAQWIERMGSKIAVESMPGVGSHFSFVLDLEVSFEAVPTMQKILQKPRPARHVPPAKVLPPLPQDELHMLGELIRMGRLGRLPDWAKALEVRHPQHQQAARLLGELAANADIAALKDLHARWIVLDWQEELNNRQREE